MKFFEPTILYDRLNGDKYYAPWYARWIIKTLHKDVVDIRNFLKPFNLCPNIVLPPDPTEWDKALGALGWVKNNINFIPDNTEHWQTPHETLQKASGDCEDGAILIANIMMCLGLEDVRILAGTTGKGVGHAVVSYKEVRYDWTQSEPIVKKWFEFSSERVWV